MFKSKSQNQSSPVAGAFFSRHLKAHLLERPAAGRSTLYGSETALVVVGSLGAGASGLFFQVFESSHL